MAVLLLNKKEVAIEALIYAPNGTITFNKEAIVVGSVVGYDIYVKKSATITYDESIVDIEDLPCSVIGLSVISYNISK